MEKRQNQFNNHANEEPIYLIYKQGGKQLKFKLNSDQYIQEQKAIQEQIQKIKLQPKQCLLCGNQFHQQFNQESTQITDCSHCFHKKCLRQWKQTNFNCPTCGKSIDKQMEIYEALKISKRLEEQKREQNQMILEVNLPDYYIRSLTEDQGESYQQVDYQQEQEYELKQQNLKEIENEI